MTYYEELSDEDKIKQAIDFVAVGQPIPDTLIAFLKRENIYDLIVTPRRTDEFSS